MENHTLLCPANTNEYHHIQSYNKVMYLHQQEQLKIVGPTPRLTDLVKSFCEPNHLKLDAENDHTLPATLTFKGRERELIAGSPHYYLLMVSQPAFFLGVSSRRLTRNK